MTEYGRFKSVKVIKHQNEGIENGAKVCYKTETEAQRSVREINRYNGLKARKIHKW